MADAMESADRKDDDEKQFAKRLQKALAMLVVSFFLLHKHLLIIHILLAWVDTQECDKQPYLIFHKTLPCISLEDHRCIDWQLAKTQISKWEQ